MARRTDNQPRFSLNKLCEFMSATPPRQRRIIRDQKYPPDYLTVYYREAQEAVAHCIASDFTDMDSVERQIAILNQSMPDSVGAQRRVTANIEALEAFLEMSDSIDLGGTSPSLGENSAPKLRVRNVDISVRPEVILRGENRSGSFVGAVKIHFPKTNSLSEAAGGYVSALLREWCMAHMPDEGTASGPHCFVVDVGSRTVHQGTRSTARRLRDLEDACETISALWPTMTE